MKCIADPCAARMRSLGMHIVIGGDGIDRLRGLSVGEGDPDDSESAFVCNVATCWSNHEKSSR